MFFFCTSDYTVNDILKSNFKLLKYGFTALMRNDEINKNNIPIIILFFDFFFFFNLVVTVFTARKVGNTFNGQTILTTTK